MNVALPDAAPSGRQAREVPSVRLVGDADAVFWVARTLLASDHGAERILDEETLSASDEERGPIVWVARPHPAGPDSDVPAVDEAVWSIPCLVVVAPGCVVPETLAGHPSVESFDIVREDADGPVLRGRLERLLSLHRRRTQTEVALQNLSDTVYTRTFDGVVTSVNAAAEKLLGRSREQLLGRHLPPICGTPEESQVELTRTNETLLSTERLAGRIVVTDAAGRSRIVDRESFLLRDGHGAPSGVQTILTDVTEELESKERLRREAERNAVLAAIAAAGRDSVDLDSVLGVSLEALGQRLGATAVLLYQVDATKTRFGATHQWSRDGAAAALIGVEVLVEHAENLRQILETNGPSVIPDVSAIDPASAAAAQLVRLGGTSAAGVPVHRQEELLGVLGLVWSTPRAFPADELDFFGRLGDLLALSIHAARLHGQLEEKLEALAEAYRRRDESDRQRHSLQSMLVHDLKNPLSAVQAAIELVLEREQRSGDARLERILRNSLASTRGLSGLIEDALVVFRPEDAPAPERLQASAAEALSLTIEEARWLAQARSVTLVADVPGDLPVLRLDPPRFRRAVANLLANALKFTPRGGTVQLRAFADQLDGKRELVVRVSDTGPGLSAETIARLATPWFRAAGTEGIPGTGLGLSVVKRVALEHGGRLEVESDGRSGSAFSLRIPY